MLGPTLLETYCAKVLGTKKHCSKHVLISKCGKCWEHIRCCANAVRGVGIPKTKMQTFSTNVENLCWVGSCHHNPSSDTSVAILDMHATGLRHDVGGDFPTLPVNSTAAAHCAAAFYCSEQVICKRYFKHDVTP